MPIYYINGALIILEVQGHSVPDWKALRYGKVKSRGLSYDSTLISVRISLKVPIYYINGALLILNHYAL